MASSAYFDQIQQLYIAYFGRPADTIGLAYWAAQVDAANGNVAQVVAGFSASVESKALYGSVSTAQKINAIYLNLFNRLPEPAGLAYWTALLDKNTLTHAEAAYQIQSSAGAGDATAVANKLAAAKAFTALIDTPAEVSGYVGDNAAAYGRAYLNSVDATPTSLASASAGLSNTVAIATGTAVSPPVSNPSPPPVPLNMVLTTGTDTFVGGAGDDTFTATLNTTTPGLSTLNAGDSINGGAGTDTLAISVTGNMPGALPAATITGIEKISISDQSTDAGPSSLYDFAGIQGVTEVISNASNRLNGLTFSNLSTGTTVKVQDSNMASLFNVKYSMATASDAVNLVLNGGLGVTSGAVSLLNIGGTATTATVTSMGAANLMGQIMLANSNTNTVTQLTINALTDLTAYLTDTDFASSATLTVTGAGKVNLGKIVTGFDGSTINAAGNTGGLTIKLNANTASFLGGSGADSVIGNASIANTASIDGGAGVDTVSAALLVNAASAAVFKNFEQIDLAGTANSGVLDVATLTQSTITGAVISGDTWSGFTLNNLVENSDGFNLSVTGHNNLSTVLGFTAASVVGATDALNVSFNAASSAIAATVSAGHVTAENVEVIKIHSGGGTNISNAITLLDSAAKSVVITGDHALNLALSAQTGVGVSQLTSIDGSAATGNLTLAIAAATTTGAQSALAIKTGAGNDTIKVATSGVAGSVGVTLTTGTGTDQVDVSLSLARASLTPQFSTITDFGAGDSLKFGNTLTFSAPQFVPVSPVDLAGALAQATAGQAANNARWFAYQGDTYIVDNVDGIDGLGAGDIVVKLSGTVNLANSTALNGVLTYTA